MPGVLTSAVLLLGGLFLIGSSIANIVVLQKAKKYPSTDKNAPSAQTFQNMTYLNVAFIIVGVLLALVGGISLYIAVRGGKIKKKL
jgi:hypothetical protein